MATKLKRFYTGFSTRNYEESGGNFAIYDVKCVEEDLLNEINTIKGERLNDPDFGTRIPLMVFENLNDEVENIIRTDLQQVFDHDPRVEVINLDILPARDNNALIAIAKLNYKEFAVTRELRITVPSR